MQKFSGYPRMTLKNRRKLGEAIVLTQVIRGMAAILGNNFHAAVPTFAVPTFAVPTCAVPTCAVPTFAVLVAPPNCAGVCRFSVSGERNPPLIAAVLSSAIRAAVFGVWLV